MNFLLIDTSFNKYVICIYHNSKRYFLVNEKKSKNQNGKILQDIDELLSKNNISLDDMDYFSSIIGPGSFTGIRIGVSIINAFSFASKKPCVEINSLEVISNKLKDQDRICLIDAMHGNYYGAIYSKSNIQVEIREYKKEEIEKLSISKIYFDQDDIDTSLYFDTMIKKIKENTFKDQLRPLYLKKSQAEREADGV